MTGKKPTKAEREREAVRLVATQAVILTEGVAQVLADNGHGETAAALRANTELRDLMLSYALVQLTISAGAIGASIGAARRGVTAAMQREGVG